MKCVMSVTAGRSCGSAGTRATLISYNHYTGFIRISGVENLLRRLLIGTVFTGLFGGPTRPVHHPLDMPVLSL